MSRKSTNSIVNHSGRLVTSSIFGGTIFYATTQLPPARSAKVMLTVGITLGLFFARKFIMTFKVMPAGVMTALRYAVFGRMLTLVCLLSISIQRSLECFKSTHKLRVIGFHRNTFLLVDRDPICHCHVKYLHCFGHLKSPASNLSAS